VVVTEAERAYFHDYYLRHDGANRERRLPGAERLTKKCKQCGAIKMRCEFTVRESGLRKGHLAGYCKECRSLSQRAKYKLNHDGDPSFYRLYDWPRNLKRYYGITVDDYHRMLAEQGGGCAICGSRNPTNGSRLYKRIRRTVFDVDHDHKTGMVRGLLCTVCNRLVGLAKDDLTTAQNLVRYLSKGV